MLSLKNGFGTYRGLIRTVLDNCLWYSGKYKSFGSIDWNRVRRVVFVCRGNICRSPFAEAVARKALRNLPTVSVGLSTTTGAPAFPMARDAARRFAIDLSRHQATDISEFEFRDGDLLCAMEARHIARLRAFSAGHNLQIALLGLWCRPRLALLYDPHGMSAEYFATCFDRIQKAVVRLGEEAANVDTRGRSNALAGRETNVSATGA